MNERHAHAAEVTRLQDELAASQKREEVKAEEARASQVLARQIGRRSKAAEAGKADAEARLQRVQEMLQRAKQEARKAKRRTEQWKCRYTQARMNERVPSSAPTSPEAECSSRR